MKKAALTPQIKKYTQLTQYLQDYFDYRKSLDSRFSFDVWAAELGFKSRSYMRMLTRGERTMTPKFIHIFSEKMNFSDSEIHHLTLLASYSKARSESQKKIYQEKLLESIETDENQHGIKDYVQFLSSPNLSVLLLLISFDDVEATNANLRKLLDISAPDLNKNLKILQKLGLIELKNKIWVSNYKSFKLEGGTKDKAYHQFHQNTFKEAQEVLNSNEEFKRFRSIYFSLAECDSEGFKSEIENFMTKLKRKYGTNYIQDKRLLKLNLQFYPVSQSYKK